MEKTQLPKAIVNSGLIRLIKALGPHVAEGHLSDEDYRKFILIHVFSMTGIIAASIFGLWRLNAGRAGLALMDFSYAAALALAYIIAVKTHKVTVVCWLGILEYFTFLVVLLVVDSGSGFVWMFLFPPISVYLLGYKHGTIITGVFLCIVSVMLLFPGLLQITIFNSSFPLKIILAMVSISIVSFSFEYSRTKANKKMQKARMAAEEASRLKNEFLSNISHEVRTPMNGIIGLLEIFSKTGLNEEQIEHLNILKETAGQSLVILNELLDLSKAEAGKLDLDPERTDLVEIANEIIATYQPKARANGILLQMSTPENLPHVMADSKRIKQILHNFLNNALKFTEKGYVKLTIEQLVKSTHGTIRLKFSVEDTGTGVPREQAQDIFEAFVQADGSYSRKHAGTGLGLAISRKITQLMGGLIGYTPRTGGGSIFWFEIELPVVSDDRYPVRNLTTKTYTSSNGQKTFDGTLSGKVLLVEDNPVNRLVADAMISRLGISVVQAEDGMKALDILSEQEVDAILMDVQMPGMDGFQTTGEIRKKEKTQHIPIIAMTAHAMKEDRDLCLQKGMDDYISKPFSEESLVQVLTKYMPQQV